MKSRKNRIIISVGITLILLTFVPLLVLLALNEYTLELNVSDGQTIQVEYGSQLGLGEVVANYKGTIFNRKGLAVAVTTEGSVDIHTLGSYQVQYQASHKGQTVSANLTFVPVKLCL